MTLTRTDTSFCLFRVSTLIRDSCLNDDYPYILIHLCDLISQWMPTLGLLFTIRERKTVLTMLPAIRINSLR